MNFSLLFNPALGIGLLVLDVNNLLPEGMTFLEFRH